jgi:predicted O-methyltransferase YrrM
MHTDFFERLDWQPDRLLLDGLVFRLQQVDSPNWELGDQCFHFYKLKTLVDEYARFWRQTDFRPRSILELGMWDGGSVAFWNLCLSPEMHVGADIQDRADSEYFRRFVESRDASDRVKTHWQVDQADSVTMRSIIDGDLGGSLDLVLDDASHRYAATKASFETIFPRLRPGGLYIIEDWAWGHWRDFQSPDHFLAKEQSLTDLIRELTEVVGSTVDVISDLRIYHGFAVVQRGDASLGDGFRLERNITRRPAPRSSLGRARVRVLKPHRLQRMNRKIRRALDRHR